MLLCTNNIYKTGKGESTNRCGWWETKRLSLVCCLICRGCELACLIICVFLNKHFSHFSPLGAHSLKPHFLQLFLLVLKTLVDCRPRILLFTSFFWFLEATHMLLNTTKELKKESTACFPRLLFFFCLFVCFNKLH